jgi:two-component system sensor histidine kinase/response regulator
MTYEIESLTVIGHELRTPISGVIGMTDLLLTTKIDEEQREFLEMIRSSAQLLLRLSADLLDFSRLESGPAPGDCVQFALRRTLHLLVQPLRYMAARKGLTLGYSVDFDVPDRLTGDPARLGHLLVNLIGNAIKYTDQGEISVNVERDGSNDGEVAVRFTVSDTGVGISPDKIARIFEPYYQVAPGRSRHSGGIGLGLAIAARLAESLGGRIWAESEMGKGSQFHFAGNFGLVEAPYRMPALSRGETARSANL